MRGRKTGTLPYGNGCKLHPNCSTCPAYDCVWIYGVSREKQESLINLWKPYFEMELSREALGGKG